MTAFGSLAPTRASTGGAGGWIPSPELNLEEYVDPMREAEKIFAAAAVSAEAQSIAETQKATERLKALYLAVSDARARSVGEIEQVQAVVRALRDENFAIAAALKEKGVALAPGHDVTKDFLQAMAAAREGRQRWRQRRARRRPRRVRRRGVRFRGRRIGGAATWCGERSGIHVARRTLLVPGPAELHLLHVLGAYRSWDGDTRSEPGRAVEQRSAGGKPLRVTADPAERAHTQQLARFSVYNLCACGPRASCPARVHTSSACMIDRVDTVHDTVVRFTLRLHLILRMLCM